MWVAEEDERDRNERGGAGRRDGPLSAILARSRPESGVEIKP
jgi:hypothetical protein